MPLTKEGKKVLKAMRKQYGEKAESVFYATMKKNGMQEKQEKKSKDEGMISPDVQVCHKKLSPIKSKKKKED